MKAKVFSFVKPSPTSMVASVRIARFLAEEAKAPLVWDETIANGALDVLFIVNGAFAFCKYLEPLGCAIVNAKRLIWVQNDYTIVPPKPESNAESPFRKAFRTRRDLGRPDLEYWTTVKSNSDWGASPFVNANSQYVNWNSLTYAAHDTKWYAKQRAKSIGDLFYYGSFRNNRVEAFDRYLGDRTSYGVTVSSPSNKFAERYPFINAFPAIKANFYEELAHHGLGLYIEDKKSHVEFHSPANRFYEMLSAGLPMIFQPEAAGIMVEAGFDVSGYCAETAKDVRYMFRHSSEIARSQRNFWHDDYVGKLRKQVRGLIRSL